MKLRLFHTPHAGFAPAGLHLHTPATLGPEDATTLDGLFRERTRRTPEAVAYSQFDPEAGLWRDFTWADTAREVARWRGALAGLSLAPGDRVAIMLGNGRDWVHFDLAALGLGLVTVPIFVNDRPDNVAWILDHAGCRALFIGGPEQWSALAAIHPNIERLAALICLAPLPDGPANLRVAADWLPATGGALPISRNNPDGLATLVYTSGTTGRPKGVMLSHRNILSNVWAGLAAVPVTGGDRMLSFLPLSHMLERTVGYYLPMASGCPVAHARSIPQLGEDLVTTRPTVLIAVPRIFERVRERILEALNEAPPMKQHLFHRAVDLGWRRFLRQQGRAPWSPGLLLEPALDHAVGARVRARLGGRLRLAICGGAPLASEVGRFFLALGVPVLQGYGLTEASPVIAVNRPVDNEPDSVGQALPDIRVRIGAEHELLTQSDSVMLGFWRDDAATRRIVDAEGWLHTGDQAVIGPRGHIRITGRIKDILVLSTGEKVSPADLEQALAASPLLDQVMVLGDGRPYLAALAVPRPGAMDDVPTDPAAREDWLLGRLRPLMHDFPGYAHLARVALIDEPWTVENGLLTPTLKLKRRAVLARYHKEVEALYEGH